MVKLFMGCLLVALSSVAWGQVKPGDDAPAFKVQDVSLEDYKGEQAVLLMFSSIGCGYAVAELPVAQEVQEADLGIAVLVINLERGRDNAALAEWKEERKMTFTAVADQQLASGKAYGARHTPTFVLIDKQGKVLGVYEGSGDGIREAVVADAKQLAKEGKVARDEIVLGPGKG